MILYVEGERRPQLLTAGVGLFGAVGIAQPLTAAAVAAAERRSAPEQAADEEIVPARMRRPKVRVETVPAEHVVIRDV